MDSAGCVGGSLGIGEDEMRAALGELEDMGLVYRAVASRDAYRVAADGRDVRTYSSACRQSLTEDGRDAEAQARLEAASLCEENPR